MNTSKFSRKINIGAKRKIKAAKMHTKNSKKSMLIRILQLIFHPAPITLVIMLGLTYLRILQIASDLGKLSLSKHDGSHKMQDFIGDPAYTAAAHLPNSKLHSRIKREVVPEEVHDPEVEGRNLVADPSQAGAAFEEDSISEMDEYHRPTHRRPARTSLDDMLLDAETSLPTSTCLKDEVVRELEERQKANLIRLEAEGKELSEYKESCETTADCLVLSPFMWAKEGSGEECRKRTYLRCYSQTNECLCQDKFDLRWDTEVEQSTFQWNQITKTCYVRGTNPCKLEIPCAPGTVCRSTVSISFNVPPIQRICECENIEHLTYAGSEDWWYCGEYVQRAWVFDLDNIKNWKHQPFHLYERMRTTVRWNNASGRT